MDNKSYFEYIKSKPFEERLRAFGNAVESMTRHSYEAAYGCEGGKEWHREEHKAQSERAEWLFADLKQEFETNHKTDLHLRGKNDGKKQ